MSWSLGEIRSLSVKATRGAGMDWGIAEEAGFAVEWLETHGLNGTRALAQYLSKMYREGNFNAQNCPLRLGCFVSDSNDWTLLQDAAVYEPILIIPFLANLLENQTLVISWDKHKVFIQRNNVSAEYVDILVSEPCKLCPPINIENCEAIKNPLMHRSRVLKDFEPYVALLNALAHNTYAPATAASRLSGAGAGLNDND